MKSMKCCKFLLLCAAAVLAVAAARAQNARLATDGVDYPIVSSTDAEGTGSRSYQWFRNDTLIVGATSADYTVPSGLAHGYNVRFVRRAMYSGACDGCGIAFSNTVTVTFIEPAPLGCNLYMGGLCWAPANVGSFRQFAANPDDLGSFYQFSRAKAWSPTGSVSGWNSNNSELSIGWNPDSSPCPAGWRLPMQTELVKLYDLSIPAGGVWAAINTKGNAIAGKFFGYNAGNCSLAPGGSMAGCIFLPATGYRDYNGLLNEQGNVGYYWSNSAFDSGSYFFLYFNSTISSASNDYMKTGGMPVRCVQ